MYDKKTEYILPKIDNISLIKGRYGWYLCGIGIEVFVIEVPDEEVKYLFKKCTLKEIK